MFDFILKNGNVIDVKNEKIDQADIAVKRWKNCRSRSFFR